MNHEQRQEIVRLLQQGEELSTEWARILFPPEKHEFELAYHGKEREEDIVAETLAVPLQKVRTFRNGDGWHNMLIFGDNLQVMKSLLQQKRDGKICNSDGTPGARQIYIDPPFGTGDEYGDSDQTAYSAKIMGAAFVEWLRKRLVFLRELLSDDGTIWVRIDYHFGHYVKVIMDEVFRENNFQNDIVINRVKKRLRNLTRFNVSKESLFFYSKNPQFYFKTPDSLRKCSFCSQEKEPVWDDLTSPGLRNPPERVIFGKTYLPRRGRHFTYTQDKIDALKKAGRLRLNPEIAYLDLEGKRIDARPEYLQTETVPVDDNWTDIKGYAFGTGYPTENHEELLTRVLSSGSKEGDLVLDAFGGSGTTAAVAERLGRRWITIDCGKLSIYTIQKRLLNLRREIGNKGALVNTKPFDLFNAGLYDFSTLKELPWDAWRFFALQLFQCRDERHKIGGITLDGHLKGSSVLVFNHQKQPGVRIDEETINSLHEALGSKIGSRMFIIAPSLVFDFQQDYLPRDNVRYFALRIPYSIVRELHQREFTALKQPSDELAVNDTVNAVGFDFIRRPELEYTLSSNKDELLPKGIIQINTFRSEAAVRQPTKRANRETLSMVMLDYDFDSESDVFDMDAVFYAGEIQDADWQVRFPLQLMGEQMMVVFVDIYGNEAREVIPSTKFGAAGKRTAKRSKKVRARVAR